MKNVFIGFIVFLVILFLTRNANAQTPAIDQFPTISSFQTIDDDAHCFKHVMTERVASDYVLGAKEGIVCK